jgi:hypothetical protein
MGTHAMKGTACSHKFLFDGTRIRLGFEAFRNGENGADDFCSTKRPPPNVTVMCVYQFVNPAWGLIGITVCKFYYTYEGSISFGATFCGKFYYENKICHSFYIFEKKTLTLHVQLFELNFIIFLYKERRQRDVVRNKGHGLFFWIERPLLV